MNQKILVIDDDSVYRAHIAEILTDEGYAVETTTGRQQVLEHLKEDDYMLVVFDLLTQQIDGLALLQEINRRVPWIDVVVISSLDEPEHIIRAFRHGAADYLVKPFNPEELSLVISRLTGVKRLFEESHPLRHALQLYDACRNLAACLDLDRLFGFALETSERLLDISAGLTLFAPKAGEPLRVLSHTGLDKTKAESWTDVFDIDAVRPFSGTPQQLGSLRLAERGKGLDDAQILVIPVVSPQNGWGLVIVARDRDKGGFSEEHLTNISFLARQMQVSFSNALEYESVHKLNYIDDMTGLYNNRYLELVLDKEIHKARHRKNDFAVLFIDIDHFKKINDSYGHLVGRMVLVELGKVLRNSVRDVDVVTRYGGDEFVVVTKVALEDALVVAKRILENLRKHVFLGREGKRIHLTASIGVAVYPDHGQSTKDLIDLADQAMYAGKKGGRDTVYLADQIVDAAAGKDAHFNEDK
jgi:diguanylate cyclase (GGDEF)-like protein